MSKTNDFKNMSYELNRRVYDDYSIGGSKEVIAKTWLDKESVGAWRFSRIYRLLDPVLESEPDAKWLTVGDGRYGGDAIYIQDKGIDVLATDISDKLLKEAYDMGCLKKYRSENAESLSFDDSEFDYVFCKESYHHFPRPMIALYEMLRVASRGVVLIEPTDVYISDSLLSLLFRKMINLIKSILGKKIIKHEFEEAGNYNYAISKREMEKMAIGINCTHVAFHGINDFYAAGSEHEKVSDNGRAYRKIKRVISLLDMLVKAKVFDYNLTAAVIFKKEPSAKLVDKLVSAGFTVVKLPVNPYLDK